MAFDFKKEYKEFYLPGKKPEFVDVPPMNYIAVRGKGNPNEEDGAYKKAVGVLYAVAYTIKMSKLSDWKIDGYFDFVVPPLEGFWYQENTDGVDYSRKEDFCWIALIRLPDFVTKKDFKTAVKTAEEKKEIDCSTAEFLRVNEGLCVQCMHTGIYDNEPKTIALMDSFIKSQGFVTDFSENRYHHEIYLSDPRKTAPEKLRTVIRHPIKEA